MATKEEQDQIAPANPAAEMLEVDDSNREAFSLEIAGFLNPIAAESPQGEALRYEGTYDRIQDARQEDADIPQGVWERELKKANWKQVTEICFEALKTRTKDLQIAAWLLEALLQMYAFAGVKEGLKLILGLCETFWDSLYPEVGEDDLESRISPFIWMNEKLSLKLKLKPITMPKSVDSQPYTFFDWENANLLENLALKDKGVYDKAESEGKVTRAKFLGSVMFTSRQFYQKQAQDLNDALEILTTLNTFLDQKCQRAAPSLKQFEDILVQIKDLVNDFLREKGGFDIEQDESVVEADQKRAEEKGVSGLGIPSIGNRTEAYQMLSAAADYLLIHEPHSPTPYLVKRAVSWGHMTLMELLHELVDNDQDLKQIYTLLGFKKHDKK